MIKQHPDWAGQEWIVVEGGVEPPHCYQYTDLNRARLPFRQTGVGCLCAEHGRQRTVATMALEDAMAPTRKHATGQQAGSVDRRARGIAAYSKIFALPEICG